MKRVTLILRDVLSVLIGIISLVATAHAQTPAPPAIRVLILSGENTHDWQKTTPFLRQTLASTGRFDVRVCETPTGLTPATLASFDVLVDDYAGPRWGSITEKTVQEFVRSGKGFVAIHGALASFSGFEQLIGNAANPVIKETAWPAFAEMTKAHWSAPPATAAVHFILVNLTNTNSPVVQGMKTNFKVADALHHGLTVSPEAEVIATASGDSKDDHEPVIFSSRYGRGRVFCTALGHEIAAMNEPLFISTFLRGTEWAATGAVSLPPELALPLPETNAIRALLITGGHDHESTFNSLFDGYKDLAWVQESSAAMAFQNDVREKYDVLVLYDFTRELDERAQQNLRSFVESGKGVLVLHHAILSYQKWPWWYEEVVGGLYRLSPVDGFPASSVKADREFFVTPAGNHPITANIGPFHLWDETYKNLWISSNIKPLLTTDNPDSDPCIAWISPYPKSRVVFIQLGHGHTAFRHPAYRALVHNSIRWVAGRAVSAP